MKTFNREILLWLRTKVVLLLLQIDKEINKL